MREINNIKDTVISDKISGMFSVVAVATEDSCIPYCIIKKRKKKEKKVKRERREYRKNCERKSKIEVERGE